MKKLQYLAVLWSDTRNKWIGYNAPIFQVKIEILTDSVDNEDYEMDTILHTING